MYNQSEFSNLENHLLEKRHYRNTSCEHVLNTYVFTGTVEFKKARFEKISLFLINRFDEKTLKIISNTFFLFYTVISLITIFNDLVNRTADWVYVLSITLFIIPLIISIFIQNVLEYYQDTFCKACGRKLACEEIDEPIMKETSGFGDYTLTVTRRWKCKYCDNVDIRESKENIFTEQGEMLPEFSLKAIECKKCREMGSLIEIKKPDIKEIKKRRLTRRYYKCTVCGHEEISENEEIVTHRINIGGPFLS